MENTSHVKKSSGQKKRRQIIGSKRNIPSDEYMAASIGDEQWLDMSLSDGRSPVSMDSNGLTPLHLAAMHGHLNCMKLLIEKYNVDVNVPSCTGWRALHLTINKDNGTNVKKCMKYLIKCGADIDICNDDNVTPLHQAASEGLYDCINFLLQRGVNVTQQDVRGHTAFDLAKLWGNRKCARVIQNQMWKSQKEGRAKNLKELNNIKNHYLDMQQEALLQLHNEHEFYGGVAFGNWLDDKGMSPASVPLPREKYPDSTVSGLERRLRAHGGMGDYATRMEVTSARKQQSPPQTRRKEDKVSPERAVKVSKVKKSSVPRQVEKIGTKEEEKELEVDETEYIHRTEWNPSTNLESPVVTDIKNKNMVGISIHPDPIKNALPSSANLSVKLDLKNKPQIKVMLPGGTMTTADLRIPRLSRHLITSALSGTNTERILVPQEFKAVHIGDVDKKRHIESGMPSEIGMHLNIYGDARFLNNPKRTPHPDHVAADRDRMLQTLHNMSPKQQFLA